MRKAAEIQGEADSDQKCLKIAGEAKLWH